MLCATCKTEISSAFKHAMAQNTCPACGGAIMDEETLALIENMKVTIASEAKLRDETTHKLAMAILAQYNVTFRDNVQQNQYVIRTPVAAPAMEQIPKIAPPSAMKKVEARTSDVIKADELIPDGISEDERERIMEEVVRKRYAVVDQVQSTAFVSGIYSSVTISLLSSAQKRKRGQICP